MRELKIDYIQSVDKSIDILDVFSTSKPSLTIEEIMKQTKIPRTTAYRLLYTLERRGLIVYDSSTSTYQLGLQFFKYFRTLSSSLNIVNIAEPILGDLQSQTGQTVLMCLLEGNMIVFVSKRESDVGLKYSSSVNEKKPVTFGVLGRAIMAFMPKEQIEAILEEPLPQWTPFSIVDKDELMKQLEEIKNNKIGVETDETTVGVSGIGAPIFNEKGNAIAAIGVLGPTITFSTEEMKTAKLLLGQAALEISEKLGYKPY
ncbi:UNVERIFIED_CONTAM: IclR family KDG regulon transcriptional repressor [Brevibacillus sp. OAP136]